MVCAVALVSVSGVMMQNRRARASEELQMIPGEWNEESGEAAGYAALASKADQAARQIKLQMKA